MGASEQSFSQTSHSIGHELSSTIRAWAVPPSEPYSSEPPRAPPRRGVQQRSCFAALRLHLAACTALSCRCTLSLSATPLRWALLAGYHNLPCRAHLWLERGPRCCCWSGSRTPVGQDCHRHAFVSDSAQPTAASSLVLRPMLRAAIPGALSVHWELTPPVLSLQRDRRASTMPSALALPRQGRAPCPLLSGAVDRSSLSTRMRLSQACLGIRQLSTHCCFLLGAALPSLCCHAGRASVHWELPQPVLSLQRDHRASMTPSALALPRPSCAPCPSSRVVHRTVLPTAAPGAAIHGP